MEFGEFFIKQVRDNSITILEKTISGEIKAPADQMLYEKINTLSNDQIEILRETAYAMIDLTLHNMLFMFEQSKSWKISNHNENIKSLSELSDGLAGELYTSDGWIKKFSKYPSSLE
jgi:hypothetical protein